MATFGNGREDRPQPPVATSEAGSSAAPADDLSGIPAEFNLGSAELLVAMAFGLAMIADDIAVESSAIVKQKKLHDQEAAVVGAFNLLRTLPADAPAWAKEFRDRVYPGMPEDVRTALVKGTAELGEQIQSRSRAMLVLVELFTFHPWTGSTRWRLNARKQSLQRLSKDLPALGAEDFDAVEREFTELLRSVRRKTIRWGRIAAVGVAGLGVGAAAGFLAAPLIGAAIGGTFGLYGAAATNAGLAYLGGGSLAAGGFGMFGGTVVVVGAGGLAGAGVGAAGARLTPLSWGEIVLEAIKADLITRLVIIHAENDDQKAKLVVEVLQQRLAAVAKRLEQLSDEIRNLRKANLLLSSENRALHQQLTAEQGHARFAQATVEVAIERIASERTSDGRVDSPQS